MLLRLLARDRQIPAFLYGVQPATGDLPIPFERTRDCRSTQPAPL